MSVDKDVQDFMDGQMAKQTLAIRAYIDGECKPCRHAMREELRVLHATMAAKQAEHSLFTQKLDQVHDEITHVVKMLEGNGHGSIDTQLQLMQQEQGHLRELLNANISERKADTVDRKETFRRACIAAIPQGMQWLALGLVLVLSGLFHSGNSNTFGNPHVVPDQVAVQPRHDVPKPSP